MPSQKRQANRQVGWLDMADDDRKLTYSERDRMRQEGGRPLSGRAKVEDEQRSQQALAVADSLFTDDKGGEEGKALADAVRAAHGTKDLPAACRKYLEGVGPPATENLASVFLDAGEKELSLIALGELLRRKAAGDLSLDGGLKRQI